MVGLNRKDNPAGKAISSYPPCGRVVQDNLTSASPRMCCLNKFKNTLYELSK